MSMRFSKKAKEAKEAAKNAGNPTNPFAKRFGNDVKKLNTPQASAFLKNQHLAAPRKTQGG